MVDAGVGERVESIFEAKKLAALLKFSIFATNRWETEKWNEGVVGVGWWAKKKAEGGEGYYLFFCASENARD